MHNMMLKYTHLLLPNFRSLLHILRAQFVVLTAVNDV